LSFLKSSIVNSFVIARSNIIKNWKLVTVYASVTAIVAAIAIVGCYKPQSGSSNSVASVSNKSGVSNLVSNTIVNSQITVSSEVATSIAADIAETANLSVANNVANLSISLAAKSSLDQTQSDSTSISKPQLIQPTADQKEIITYTAAAGDTVQSVAQKYNISADTIKWANNLTSDALNVGQKVIIMPVNGVLYTVKDGDTVQSVAQKYGADPDRVTAYNNLELNGIKTGQQIILPDGILPENERPGYVAPTTTSTTTSTNNSSSSSNSTIVSTNYANTSAGNKYSFGECTWYVYERRLEMGEPVGSFWGNASSWSAYARLAGYTVNSSPSAGAVMQTSSGYYGHVAIVESVNSDGSITVGEMNYSGWDVVDHRTIAASEVSNYNYIH
jgi:surface antigen